MQFRLGNRKLMIFVLLSGIVGFGAFLRFYRLANEHLTCETHNILWGIRLHYLPFLNFKADPLDNFFKSFFFALGGIRYALSGYLSAILYKILHLPLTEFWLLSFHALLGTLMIIATYFLGKKWGNCRIAVLAAAGVAINPGAILSSRWDNGEPLVSLVVTLSVLALFHLGRTKSHFQAFGYGLLVSILISTEAIMGAPLLVIYSFFALSDRQDPFRARIASAAAYFKSSQGLCAIFPLSVTLLTHVWIFIKYGRLGHVGMFGLMTMNYSQRMTLAALLPRVVAVFNHYGGYYFDHRFFVATLILGFFLAISPRVKIKDTCLGYSMLGSVYFFVFFIFLPKTLTFAEHMYMCESINHLFIASVWVEVGSIVLGFGHRWQISRLISFGSTAVTILGFYFCGYQVFQEALRRPSYVHPMKSLGYYIRHYGGKQATVMNLWGCGTGVCLNFLSEYYYGKQIHNEPDSLRYPKKLFCSEEKETFSHTLESHHLKEATFYVKINSIYLDQPGYGHIPQNNFTPPNVDDEMRKLGAHKVAEVTNENEVMAEIYSKEQFPFVSMDLKEYDRKWGQEFGTYDRLIEGPRVGIVATFGNYR